MTEAAPDTNPTQLLRYLLQIAGLTDAESIGQVRQVLTGLGLLVDRIEAGEAEVAVAAAANPGPEGIRAALESAGYSVQNITAESS
ncbi:hypothetical protein HMJ29_20110 [Hymenobacter taeanensis]|uniref:Uncharacterized protein n=1 Tax=Hymenobacter taeanensis TaxID=2735321 RepID=A0A6M6BLR4_9BACT|nr:MULTISPECIES: hypothetical protein [Hymenobacter]QJX49086.1 hypothetical protein HMJ29_20110 [Hymenobacter taeanensis]UOQ81393.1 hypothetical protein MUN83_00910 [Hymenobacter sp. 5414T-23]